MYLRKYFMAGLLVLIPIAITVWVLGTVINAMDGVLHILPKAWHPDLLIGTHIPGFGVILALLIVILTGFLAANFLGKRVLVWWDKFLNRIPVVRSIYGSVKQVSDTLFSDGGNAFRKALLVQYPRAGMWTIAFQTGTPSPEVAKLLTPDYVSVYIPTTPNPTSGFFIMLPMADVIPLDMSVDEALKYVVSMGVVSPNLAAPEQPALFQEP